MTFLVAPRFDPPPRMLMGPGPSSVHPRVLEAMSAPLVGHLDPACLQMLDEIQSMLRGVFQTSNDLTYPVSGTGTAAMECAMTNVLEPEDVALIGVSGAFGERMAEIAGRCGADVRIVGGTWGVPVMPEQVQTAIQEAPQAKVLGLVHAETSTGVRQPLDEIGAICRERGVLLVVDAVASLGGIEVDVDGWGIDIAYSATQKCLSVPPGLAPITFSARAVEARERRPQAPPSFYLDALLIRRYLGTDRLYHHTAPISLLYGLHEGLRIVLEEGLDPRWRRHDEIGAMVLGALEDRGFRSFAPQGYRLPQLLCMELPEGLDERPGRLALLERHGIEVGGGLGPLAGKVWRVGLMGESSNDDYAKALLQGVDELLDR